MASLRHLEFETQELVDRLEQLKATMKKEKEERKRNVVDTRWKSVGPIAKRTMNRDELNGSELKRNKTTHLKLKFLKGPTEQSDLPQRLRRPIAPKPQSVANQNLRLADAPSKCGICKKASANSNSLASQKQVRGRVPRSPEVWNNSPPSQRQSGDKGPREDAYHRGSNKVLRVNNVNGRLVEKVSKGTGDFLVASKAVCEQCESSAIPPALKVTADTSTNTPTSLDSNNPQPSVEIHFSDNGHLTYLERLLVQDQNMDLLLKFCSKRVSPSPSPARPNVGDEDDSRSRTEKVEGDGGRLDEFERLWKLSATVCRRKSRKGSPSSEQEQMVYTVGSEFNDRLENGRHSLRSSVEVSVTTSREIQPGNEGDRPTTEPVVRFPAESSRARSKPWRSKKVNAGHSLSESNAEVILPPLHKVSVSKSVNFGPGTSSRSVPLVQITPLFVPDPNDQSPGSSIPTMSGSSSRSRPHLPPSTPHPSIFKQRYGFEPDALDPSKRSLQRIELSKSPSPVLVTSSDCDRGDAESDRSDIRVEGSMKDVGVVVTELNRQLQDTRITITSTEDAPSNDADSRAAYEAQSLLWQSEDSILLRSDNLDGNQITWKDFGIRDYLSEKMDLSSTDDGDLSPRRESGEDDELSSSCGDFGNGLGVPPPTLSDDTPAPTTPGSSPSPSPSLGAGQSDEDSSNSNDWTVQPKTVAFHSSSEYLVVFKRLQHLEVFMDPFGTCLQEQINRYPSLFGYRLYGLGWRRQQRRRRMQSFGTAGD